MNDLISFFKEIQHLNYVVQRNWEELPNGFSDEHDDLDLFVSEQDYDQLVGIAEKYPELKIDVRRPLDGYYPLPIGEGLLMGVRMEKDLFWIPDAVSHFVALYYHNLIHKEGNPYKEKLEKLFKEAYPPIQCKDRGVGYFV